MSGNFTLRAGTSLAGLYHNGCIASMGGPSSLSIENEREGEKKSAFSLMIENRS